MAMSITERSPSTLFRRRHSEQPPRCHDDDGAALLFGRSPVPRPTHPLCFLRLTVISGQQYQRASARLVTPSARCAPAPSPPKRWTSMGTCGLRPMKRPGLRSMTRSGWPEVKVLRHIFAASCPETLVISSSGSEHVRRMSWPVSRIGRPRRRPLLAVGGFPWNCRQELSHCR